MLWKSFQNGFKWKQKRISALAKLVSSMLLLSSLPTSAAVENNTHNQERFKFALVGKDNLQFFTQAHLGCRKAESELENISCDFHAPEFPEVELQDSLISRLLDQDYDGLAISVLQSKYLAENSLLKAKKLGIPIITFDSDIDRRTRSKSDNLRAGYIGTDNVELGRMFARQLRRRNPDGGVVCIQTGRSDSPNLMERLKGLRAELSGDDQTRAPGLRLNGANGWYEHARCPLYSYEDPKVALHQFSFILNRELNEIDSFVALGGWLQFLPHDYVKAYKPYKNKLDSFGISVLIADTLFFQLELLQQGYSSANIGQSPFEMGRLSMHSLLNIKQSKPVPEFQYTPIKVCELSGTNQCLNSDD